MKPIFLIGLPGSGKSTFGKSLATKLDLNYVDLDGNLLIKDDPYNGVKIDSGRLKLSSSKTGLGIELKKKKLGLL